MNEIAITLNKTLENHVSSKLLSSLGKRMYFPQGIVAQTEQSKQASIKATAGMALKHMSPIMLSTIKEKIPSMEAKDIVAYAPVAGIPELRNSWQQHQLALNPALNTSHISLPIVSSGLTHSIHIASSLFINRDDTVITQEYIWDNYEHIVETYREATIKRCTMFDTQGHFQANTFKHTLEQVAQKQQKIILMLNFPNNPTGQCLLQKDIEKVCTTIAEFAKQGIPIVILCDDAYFSMFYDDDTMKTSLFSHLSSLHENILAIKIDGATKELLVWGFRVGFITFGNPQLSDAIIHALEQKVMGLIRSTITSASRLSQSLVLDILKNQNTPQELATVFNELKSKYAIVKSTLKELTKKYPSSPITPLHFNGGYFMSFNCNTISAKKLRTALLEKEKIALIQIDNLLRFTFASVEEEDIPHVLHKVYEQAQQSII